MQTVIPPSYRLSDDSLDQLRILVIEEIGQEKANSFSQKDLHHFGIFLLTLAALGLEIRRKEAQEALLHE